MGREHHIPEDRGGLPLALLGFMLLSCGDAVVKTMSGDWAPTAIAALRYGFAAAALSALLFMHEGPSGFVIPRLRLQILRGFSVAVATVTFFSSLLIMPLAEATTIVFVSPLITGLLAPIFLKERASAATWIASAMALAGVVIVLRPNLAELGVTALLPLVSALAMSTLFMANRAAAGHASPLAMQAVLALAALPVLLVTAIAGHYSGVAALVVSAPSAQVILKCAVVAASASCAHWLIYLGTTRSGAASFAPMTYVQLLVATGLGWLLFGDRPDAATVLGAAIIIGAGLFLWRTNMRKPTS